MEAVDDVDLSDEKLVRDEMGMIFEMRVWEDQSNKTIS